MKTIGFLEFEFRILSLTGVWRPMNWTSKSQRILYKIYSSFCVFEIFSLVVFQLLLLALTEVNIQVLTETLFTMLTSLTVCTKTLNFIFRRDKLLGLANMLTKSWCVPQNPEEEEIQKKSNNLINLYTIVLNTMGLSTVVSMLLLPLVRSDAPNILPIQIWLPRAIWDFHKHSMWFVYAYEALSMIVTVVVDATADPTISGFMWQACTQFELIKHRLERLPGKLRKTFAEGKTSRETLMKIEKENLVQAVLHHNYAIEYAMKVNEVVDFVVVEQFVASTLIISVIVFQLSMNRHVGPLVYILNILYLGGTLLEFFSFCWFGNEITLKCEEFGLDLYKMDWESLSPQAHKMMMFIVLRTRKPVILSVGHFIVLSVESFKSIIKVSFTAFNVLKESA